MAYAAYNRSDIRTIVRDFIKEQSGAAPNIWTDALLNRLIRLELDSLPTYDIYLEQIWFRSLVIGQDNYKLPTNWVKIDRLEINYGDDTNPRWEELKGWDTYGNGLYLPFIPQTVNKIRGFMHYQFANPDNDSDALEISSDKLNVIVYGVVLRCYEVLIGYLRSNTSWDSVTKPGDLQITVIMGYIDRLERKCARLKSDFSTAPRPRDIDLVS